MPTAKKRTAAKIVSTPVRTSAVNVSIAKKAALHTKKPTILTNKPVIKKGWNLGMQLAIATSAIAVLLILGILDRTFSTQPSKAAEVLSATIGVEHEGAITLSVVVARKANAGYTSITNQSNETIHVSVPSQWKRSEVTGVPLSQVTQDIPVFGFARWTLPAHAGIKMLMDDAPTTLFFDSTSATTAAIDLQTIDLTTLSASSKVVLLQKQVLVQLWDKSEE